MTVSNEVNDALSRFKASYRKSQALNYASSIMFWDASTGAPKSGADVRSEAVGVISGYNFKNFFNAQMGADLELLTAHRESLDKLDQISVKKAKKQYDQLMKVPPELYEAYSAFVSKSTMVWEEAKAASDFAMMQPYYDQILSYLKEFAEIRGSEGHVYNLYLDNFEEGMTIEQLDVFFEGLRARIVPLLKRVMDSDATVDDSFLRRDYPVDAQAELSETLLETIGFDLSKGLFKESEHPFTIGIDVDDVRLTTHYYENDVVSGMLSTIHEGGHGIYEQNFDRSLKGTPLASAASSGVHESQSRIFENNFARSKAFLSHLFKTMQARFETQLVDVSFDAFYAAMNKVTPSLIRTEADELTYSLHVMLRYEIERGLFEGSIQIADLPAVWREKMKGYLGIEPEDDRTGVLQDVHWGEGLFGYFPTYVIGTALAAQLEHYMRKDIDVDAHLSKGEFAPMKAWLTEKIHRHGSVYTPNELVELATGEPLNSQYYCDYLEKKYSEIYKLS